MARPGVGSLAAAAPHEEQPPAAALPGTGYPPRGPTCSRQGGGRRACLPGPRLLDSEVHPFKQESVPVSEGNVLELNHKPVCSEDSLEGEFRWCGHPLAVMIQFAIVEFQPRSPEGRGPCNHASRTVGVVVRSRRDPTFFIENLPFSRPGAHIGNSLRSCFQSGCPEKKSQDQGEPCPWSSWSSTSVSGAA